MSSSTPDSRSAALSAGLQELQLPASEAQRGQLLAYVELLHKWNQAYNLSAVRDPQQMIRQHLLDCLAVIAPLDRWTEKEQTQAEVETFILDSVYTELPDPPYSPEDKQALAASVYRHIWQRSVRDLSLIASL